MSDQRGYTERFEQRVWLKYPKRNGVRQGKKPAFERWKKLTEAQKLHVIDQIEKRNRYDGWGKYIKDCERWLRDNVDDEFEIPRTYSDPQAIVIPSKEGPRQECPAKRAMNRIWLAVLMGHYRAGGGQLSKEHIKQMMAVRDSFAQPLLEAWKAGEPLDGVKETLINQWREVMCAT